MSLRDGQGRTITLGPELGRGGEGSVYEVQGASDQVAKLYKEAVAPGKAAKLAAMAKGATPALLQVAAWPTGILHNGNRVVGLIMPKVVGYREIHQLYGPKHRRLEFSRADWSFLVHAARNVAAAVETIHAGGHVIGDVNQGNIVVSQHATVKLIDCDSFQTAFNGMRYLCEVGVPHFTPPELHGRSFAGVVRSPNHDAFGLAVTLFHLLFFGRHPFAGRYQGRGDMPIEKAIVEHRFAYSQHAAARQMLPPPHTLSIAHVSFGLASLFERAFAPEGDRAGRPTATEWVAALEAYKRETHRCSASTAHSYHKSLPRCPLCDIERALGSDFFVVAGSATGIPGTVFDLEMFWRQIQSVPPPETANGLAPTLPKAAPQPLPAGVRRARVAAWFAAAATAGFGVAMFTVGNPFGWLALGLFFVWRILEGTGGLKSEHAQRKARLDTAMRQFDSGVERVKHDVEEFSRRFLAARQKLEVARDEYRNNPAAEQKALQDLTRQLEAAQRQRYLERFFIARAGIPGIGPGLTATLASYGIEAADDVTRNIGRIVPGFGPARTRDLMAWRASIEQRFQFDSSKGVDPADKQAVRSHHARRRQELERVLRAGPTDLLGLREQSRRQRELAAPQLTSLASALAQAKADAHLL